MLTREPYTLAPPTARRDTNDVEGTENWIRREARLESRPRSGALGGRPFGKCADYIPK